MVDSIILLGHIAFTKRSVCLIGAPREELPEILNKNLRVQRELPLSELQANLTQLLNCLVECINRENLLANNKSPEYLYYPVYLLGNSAGDLLGGQLVEDPQIHQISPEKNFSQKRANCLFLPNNPMGDKRLQLGVCIAQDNKNISVAANPALVLLLGLLDQFTENDFRESLQSHVLLGDPEDSLAD